MTSHANCPHPATKKDRAACRKAQASGLTHAAKGLTSDLRKVRKQVQDLRGPKSIAEACEVGNIDHDTLDDRIRAARRRPTASPVKVSKVEG